MSNEIKNPLMAAIKVAANGTHDEAISLADMLKTDKTPRAEICETHGEFFSRNIFGNIWTTCPACSHEKEEEKRMHEEKELALRKVREYEYKLRQAGIPERFKDRSLDSYIPENQGQKHALDFANTFANEFDNVLQTGRSAIFCGKPGTGKTHLAVGIALHAMKLNKLCGFTTVQRAIRRIKDSWRKDSDESESEVINLHVSPDLLIIDEIGVQFGTEFEKNFLFDILNERYEKRKPTLLLSNLTPAEVKGFLGERVYDRLREDGGKCIAFDWDSYRGK